MALSTTSPNAFLSKACLPKATLIVPVLNAEIWLPALLKCLTDLVNTGAYQCIIIDSESTDATPALCQACPAVEFISIKRSEFNHGGTRNLAISKAQADILVYLSQDALPTPAAVELLVNALINQPSSEQPQLAAAYGRQLPNATAQPFGRTCGCLITQPKVMFLALLPCKSAALKRLFCRMLFVLTLSKL